MSKHWYFVINPVSGKGEGLNLWGKIQPLLDQSNLDYSFGISQFHKHTIELVREKYQAGFRYFIGIGGDGTLNEIVNAVFQSQKFTLNNPCTISIVSVGTGNDWARNQEKLTISNLIPRLEKCTTIPHDIGFVQASNLNLKHYFINVAGIGLDGKVVEEIEKLNDSGKKGKLSYVQSMLKALTSFEAPVAKIYTDNRELYSGETLVLVASKGQFFGGGMHISPKAKPNNGTLDLTVVKKDSNWMIFPQLYKLFNGHIASATFVKKYEDTHVRIQSNHAIPIQADGEFLGKSSQVEFSVLKHAILVLA
tara:strand:+ start:32289 stop:33209 length:921 start_codon:yes stop_codon:yes gene_type:complete